MITKTLGVCGGDACIGGTRIPVWAIIRMRQNGALVSRILESYPHLSHWQIQEALEYGAANQEEIAICIAENEM